MTMIDEQTTDNITVDVETGERSDSVPSFEIVEHEGVKYVAANQADLYKAAKSEELAAMQTEIDDILNSIAEIDRINAVEERQAEMQKLIDQFGEDYNMTDVIDFEDEQEWCEIKAYLTAVYQASHGNPSAGFGAKIESRSHSPRQWQYEQGAAAAREIFQKRGR